MLPPEGRQYRREVLLLPLKHHKMVGERSQDSHWLNNYDFEEEVQEPIEVLKSRKLDELRREKHEQYTLR